MKTKTLHLNENFHTLHAETAVYMASVSPDSLMDAVLDHAVEKSGNIISTNSLIEEMEERKEIGDKPSKDEKELLAICYEAEKLVGGSCDVIF